jgi:glycine cleavage system H lipoate-binding protein
MPRRFTRDHMTIDTEGTSARLGVAPAMRELLGEPVTFNIEPAGTRVEAGESFGSARGKKRACALYAPFTLAVVQAEAEGALVTVEGRPDTQLLDEAAYTAHLGAIAKAARANSAHMRGR